MTILVEMFIVHCSMFNCHFERTVGGDSVSSVAAVREAQARQRAASRNDRRRCLNCCTVGAPRSASAIARSLKDRAPLQLGNRAIFKLSHYLLALGCAFSYSARRCSSVTCVYFCVVARLACP